MAKWSPAQVARLLRRRPDLLNPKPPANLAELAARAEYHAGVADAIDATTLAENRLLQVIVCCPQAVTLDEFAAALPEGVGLDDVAPFLAALEEAALVWCHDGRLNSSEALRQAMPTKLGPPLQMLAGAQTVDYLKSAIAQLRNAPALPPDLPLPPRAGGGPKAKAPRKAELIDELAALLATPGVVQAVLETAPTEPRELTFALAEGPTTGIRVRFPLYFTSYRNTAFYTREPAYWLFERGLLLPSQHDDMALQPREVGVALRGGRPVLDLALAEPTLTTHEVDPVAVDSEAALQATATTTRLSDLVEMLADTPVKELKSGGLGVNVVKKLATRLDVGTEETARLLELSHLGGLLESITTETKQGRKSVVDYFVGATAEATAWVAQPMPVRWRQMARAWLRAELWPSATGRKTPEGKAGPAVLMPQHQAGDAPDRRADVLTALAGLDRGDGDGRSATSVEALRDSVYWRRPQPWLAHPAGEPATAIGWIYEEAVLLGIAAQGRLSSFGKAVTEGAFAEAERLFAGCVPAEGSVFTLQADMTAVVVGRLGREVLTELRLLADIESAGAASTFRFSEPSLRRALDAGRDAATILEFLKAHADKGVPQALEYMVRDVARRHGHLRVGRAGAFVTSEDAAVLADACSHRRTRKLGLRLLAPTVAVSHATPDKVMAALRDAGFLPTAAPGDEAAAPSGGAEVVALTSRRSGDDTAVTNLRDLPEPFRQGRRRGARSRSTEVLDAAQASDLATHICSSQGEPTQPLPGFDGVDAREPGDDVLDELNRRFADFDEFDDDFDSEAFDAELVDFVAELKRKADPMRGPTPPRRRPPRRRR